MIKKILEVIRLLQHRIEISRADHANPVE